jgi:transcriptional regulator with XRE-family HTH domain
MVNDNLRAALQHAGLAPDDLANIVQVDVRTVRRWLSGGTPYARQRGKVARALDVPEHDLWPDIATPPPRPPAAQPNDVLAAYTAASDLAAPDWKALMHAAADRIDLLGDTLSAILGTPGVPELLAAKATQGCTVRILIYDTREHIAPLFAQPGIEVRLLEVPARYVIHRFDDELLLTLHVVGADPDHAPLIHLRRAASEGMFDRLAEYYGDLWEQDSEPLGTELDIEPEEEQDEDEDPETDPQLSAPGPLQAAPSEPSAPPPRRWPGRAQGPPGHR